MKKRRLITRTIILIVLATAVGYSLYANLTKGDSVQVSVGSQAPDFELTDMHGIKHKLSDYRGQGVFLNFWGTWCTPCQQEMPYINNEYHQFKDQGVQVLAVDINETDIAVNQFASRYSLDFPIMIDKDKQVMNVYGIDPLPATFLIDKNGKVVQYITGQMTEDDVRGYMEKIKP